MELTNLNQPSLEFPGIINVTDHADNKLVLLFESIGIMSNDWTTTLYDIETQSALITITCTDYSCILQYACNDKIYIQSRYEQLISESYRKVEKNNMLEPKSTSQHHCYILIIASSEDRCKLNSCKESCLLITLFEKPAASFLYRHLSLFVESNLKENVFYNNDTKTRYSETVNNVKVRNSNTKSINNDLNSDNGNRMKHSWCDIERKDKNTVTHNEFLRVKRINEKLIASKQHVKLYRKGNNNNRTLQSITQFSILFAVAIIISVLETASCEDINVSWKMKSNMIIFGKTAELQCVISDFINLCNRTLHQWYGGTPYAFLCRNGACRNKEKYKEHTDSMCKYNLQIYNFSESDVNCEYTCSYGLNRYRKMLVLDKDHFAYIPSMSEVNYTAIGKEKDMLNISLFIQKVFPKPSCKASISDKNIPIKTDITHNGYMYTTELRIEYKPPVSMCRGVFKIICTIGSSHFIPVYNNITFCNADDKRQHDGGNAVLYVAVIIPLLVVVMVIALVFYQYRNQQLFEKCTPCHNYDLAKSSVH